jgi:hypothetical protein
VPEKLKLSFKKIKMLQRPERETPVLRQLSEMKVFSEKQEGEKLQHGKCTLELDTILSCA